MTWLASFPQVLPTTLSRPKPTPQPFRPFQSIATPSGGHGSSGLGQHGGQHGGQPSSTPESAYLLHQLKVNQQTQQHQQQRPLHHQDQQPHAGQGQGDYFVVDDDGKEEDEDEEELEDEEPDVPSAPAK